MAAVSILMGSESDLDTVSEAIAILKDFKVGFQARVLSAHRTPKEVARYVEQATASGTRVFIAAAGGAAALAGVVAAHTVRPVIGIPIETKTLKGLDSLLSTVQMPAGIPVAGMSIGKAGARNAALLAVQILAVSDRKLTAKFSAYKQSMRAKIKKIRLKL
jgi:5-(carboxyamino)imidazole ribonucleotide mutase